MGIVHELYAPCRCVYPDKCFCKPVQKEARTRKLSEEYLAIEDDPGRQAEILSELALINEGEDILVLIERYRGQDR